MSRTEVTTQDLFLRLGPTWRSRSARADALFRQLRTQQNDGDAAEQLASVRGQSTASHEAGAGQAEQPLLK